LVSEYKAKAPKQAIYNPGLFWFYPYIYETLFAPYSAANNRHIIEHREKNIHKKYDCNDMMI